MRLFFARTQLGQHLIAALRGKLELGYLPRAHNIRKRANAGRHLADDAGVETMIERQALGRFLDLDDNGAFGKMVSRRIPDVLEEWAAQQYDEIGILKCLANLRGIARE